MESKDDEQASRKFKTVKARQLLATVLTVAAVLVLAAASRRPDLFGQVSKKTVLISQVAVILAFVNFSSWNWRCPSCRKSLGNDLVQKNCRRCGARLR